MDNRIKTEKMIRKLLKSDFKYIYQEDYIGRHKIHLSFQMQENRNTYGIQMSFEFSPDYLDILCFISPTVLTDRYYPETLSTVNMINYYLKSFGRFYIDYNNDVAYSLRIPNNIVQEQPELTLSEIEAAIDIYEDMFDIILGVAQGKKDIESCRKYIEDVWG